MQSTIIQAITLAFLKFLSNKSIEFKNKAASVIGLDKEYKRIETEKDAALKALAEFKKISDDKTLTSEQKDKKHEEIANSIADKLRNM